jgi:hypothetical protein
MKEVGIQFSVKSECCSCIHKHETECGPHAKYIHDSVRNCVIETCTFAVKSYSCYFV